MLLLILLGGRRRRCRPAQNPAPATAVDASRLKLGPPRRSPSSISAALKGELRQIGLVGATTRSVRPDCREGDGPAAKASPLHCFGWRRRDRRTRPAPAWARRYWAFKPDRAAPGIGDLSIDLDRKSENGHQRGHRTGRSALDRETSPLGGNVGNMDTIAEGSDQKHKQTAHWCCSANDQRIRERAGRCLGLMFSWGPSRQRRRSTTPIATGV